MVSAREEIISNYIAARRFHLRLRGGSFCSIRSFVLVEERSSSSYVEPPLGANRPRSRSRDLAGSEIRVMKSRLLRGNHRSARM